MFWGRKYWFCQDLMLKIKMYSKTRKNIRVNDNQKIEKFVLILIDYETITHFLPGMYLFEFKFLENL